MRVLTEPFAYAFFGRAMLAGVIIGAMTGALSVFVLLRRMSYIGHGLAHAVLGGVAVGLAFGAHIYVGSFVSAVVAAVLIDRVTRRRVLHADAAIGIVTTAIFAVGIVVLSLVPSRVNVEAVLFGNILGVAQSDLWVAAAVAVAFAVVLAVWFKQLVLVTFDPEIAVVHGVRTGMIEVLFSLATAAVIVASVRVLGVLLIAAAVVIPGAVARLVTRSIGAMLAVATVVGVASSVVGLFASYHVDVPSGPTIVLAGTATFLVAFCGAAVVSRSGLAAARRATARDLRERSGTPGDLPVEVSHEVEAGARGGPLR